MFDSEQFSLKFKPFRCHGNNIILQIQHAFDDRSQPHQRLKMSSFTYIQAFIGVSWILGCSVFGFVMIRPSKDCQISKLRLNQIALIMLSLINLILPYASGYHGLSIYSIIYGFFYGGYSLSLKLYLYEIGNPRHFCLLWSIAQLLQGRLHTDRLNRFFIVINCII